MSGRRSCRETAVATSTAITNSAGTRFDLWTQCQTDGWETPIALANAAWPPTAPIARSSAV